LAVSLYDSEPEPDLAIVRATSDYCEHHPTTGEIGLVVEVADTSLSRDRLKESIYAQADLPTYWIVDLKRRQVEVHTSPDVAGRRYQEVRVVREDEKIPVILDGQSIGEIAVADFLPPVA
ncbi:MAG: Uma2 family endonuclease, partial [Planctomycetaceae bacterium]|nr:Uma2 family endonuclease [Planctomycetaceae bacterium]